MKDEPMARGIPLQSSVPPAQRRYSGGAIVLHWLIALALAFQLALGFAMPKGAAGFTLFQLHKSVGITILLLTLVRIGWRLTHRPPPAVEGGFTGLLAKAVHYGLYAFMLLAPLTGWALVSTDPLDIPTFLYGAIPWPHLPLPDSVNEAMEEGHEILAFLGIALFLLHVIGALRHQLLIRDGLMRRMGPGGSAVLAGLLSALVIVLFFGTGAYIANRNPAPAQGPDVEAEAPASPEPALVEPDPTATPEAEESEASEESAEEAEDAEEPEQEAEEPVAAASEPGPPPVWTIQPGKRLAFSVGNNGEMLNGTFSDWSGEIAFDPANPESANIRIAVQLASATLGDTTQDNMLQGAEFFAIAANPTATWRSTSVRRTGPGRYTAQGTLRLKGVSRPQSLTFTLSGEGMNRSVQGSATIDRTGFGVGTGSSAEGLTPNVSLSFAFDAVGRQP